MDLQTSEGGQWLTYAEAGQRFGVSQEAARQLAKRRGWRRRTPNEPNELARVLVPDDAYVRPRTPVNGGAAVARTAVNGGQPAVDRTPVADIGNDSDRGTNAVVRAYETAIAAITAHRDREKERADRAEHRIDELQTALADARTAERIARDEAAAIRGQADRRRSWSLRRRLAWALRGQ